MGRVSRGGVARGSENAGSPETPRVCANAALWPGRRYICPHARSVCLLPFSLYFLTLRLVFHRFSLLPPHHNLDEGQGQIWLPISDEASRSLRHHVSQQRSRHPKPSFSNHTPCLEPILAGLTLDLYVSSRKGRFSRFAKKFHFELPISVTVTIPPSGHLAFTSPSDNRDLNRLTADTRRHRSARKRARLRHASLDPDRRSL